LKSEFKLASIEALPGEIEGKSSAFGTSDGLYPPLVKTDDASEQEWFPYWNADLAPASCWR
jgi:hypothetical protein